MAKNLVGMKFGRLTVISRAENHVTPSGGTKAQWNCECECGNHVIVTTCNLTTGNSKSCGCYGDEIRKTSSITHNQRHSRLYGVWSNIKDRCYNESSGCYKNYGGRGICMCDEWKDSFESFSLWAYGNGYDPSADRFKCTIDRIDVNGMYCPDNCRWVDQKTQSNNRRNTFYITTNEETHTLSEWSDITGIKYHTLFARINKLGWEPEAALGLTSNQSK